MNLSFLSTQEFQKTYSSSSEQKVQQRTNGLTLIQLKDVKPSLAYSELLDPYGNPIQFTSCKSSFNASFDNLYNRELVQENRGRRVFGSLDNIPVENGLQANGYKVKEIMYQWNYNASQNLMKEVANGRRADQNPKLDLRRNSMCESNSESSNSKYFAHGFKLPIHYTSRNSKETTSIKLKSIPGSLEKYLCRSGSCNRVIFHSANIRKSDA